MTNSLSIIPSGCPVAHALDPFDPDQLEDPYPILNTVREEAPVQYVPSLDHWIVSRYDDIRQILSDDVNFSAKHTRTPFAELTEEARIAFRAGVPTEHIFDTDPPVYSQFRRRLARFFTPRAAQPFETVSRAAANRMIDAFIDRGRADLVQEMFFPLPAHVAFVLLGFPDEALDKLRGWASNKVEVIWGRPAPEQQLDVVGALADFWQYCDDFVELRKHEPGDDITTRLLAAQGEGEDSFTDPEIKTLVYGLAFAGHDTTTNFLGNAMRQLMTRDGLWQRIQDDPSIIGGVLEETLRMDSSVVCVRRTATADVDVGGVTIPAGGIIYVSLAAGNHDPRHFDDPETFDPARATARDHLSFGRGAHFCLGQHLARIEGRAVFEVLADRLPDLRLLDGQRVDAIPNIMMHGPRELWVEWKAAS